MDPRAQSPLWLRERLRRNGLRPVSAIVDVTNYVMLELGQPLHAFDDARLHGGVSIRMARADERLKVIAGETIALDEQCLVIADENAPIALAGVMGGAETAVNDATRRVFLESAYFTPLAVAGRGRQFKLHTDALHRFERGVYPNLQVKAIERASRLLLDMAGGEAGPLVEADHRPAGPAPAITLRRARIARLLGSAIPAPEIEAILQRLGFDCERMDDENWQVRPPGFRYDIAREADLVEEVARLHGFESLPARQRWAESRFIPVPETQTPPARLRQALVQRGYQEAITYSFSEPGLDAMLTPALPAVSVDNPIADTMSEMRTTLWSGLLTAWVYNLQRQQARIRLFEIGRTFHLEKNEIAQTMRLAGLAGGPALPEQWGAQARELDFYDMKGDVEALLVSAGKTPAHDLAFRAEAHPALHPGQSARIVLDGWPAGWCGRLQPQLARKLRAKGSCLLFELSLTALGNAVIPSYRQVPEYPSIRRDLALVVNDAVNAADLIECIQAVGVSTLVEAFPFDLYRGGSLQEGQKSIAFGLIFQDKYRTLKDDEVDAVVARIQARLAAELGADIRG
jgi:phenylalanyl-tRNA synthetase beta chain